MSTIVVLTRTWPYAPGEQFIDPESRQWKTWVDRGARVVVMPWTATGQPRVQPPAGIEIDLTLARASATQRRSALVRGVTSRQFVREIPGLLRHPSQVRAVEIAHALRGAQLTADLLGQWAAAQGGIDLIYSYWLEVFAMGSLLLKQSGRVGAVVSRVHNYDVYEERHPARYHALRRQLAPHLDALLPVSRDGGEAAARLFGIPRDRIIHSPLGIELTDHRTEPSRDGVFRLLNVAITRRVKRIDKVIDALHLLAESRPDLRLHYHHLGGGDLLTELQARAQARHFDNLSITWAGQVSVADVEAYYRDNPVDVFINSAEYEGVPVSLMEAMGHGVPLLAPDVGAVRELVPSEGDGGELMPADLTVTTLAEVIERWADLKDTTRHREAAARIVSELHDVNLTGRRLAATFASLSPAVAADLAR